MSQTRCLSSESLYRTNRARHWRTSDRRVPRGRQVWARRHLHQDFAESYLLSTGRSGAGQKFCSLRVISFHAPARISAAVREWLMQSVLERVASTAVRFKTEAREIPATAGVGSLSVRLWDW